MDMVCQKCGAPSGLYAGHQVRGCACEMAGPPLKENPFTKMKEVHEVASDPSYNALREIVAMECSDIEGNLTSHGKIYFAKAIKMLAMRNEVSITSERGPIIKARWN